MNATNGHHPDCERTVLGTMLYHGNAAVEILRDAVGLEAMYEAGHREIYSAVMWVVATGGDVSIGTVTRELERRRKLEEVGGEAALTELYGNWSSGVPRGALGDAKVVHEDYVRRILRDRGERLAAAAMNRTLDVADVMGMATTIDADLEARTEEIPTLGQLAEEVREEVREAAASPQTVRGIPTRIPKLDRMLHGLQKKDLIVVCARPSAGKTAFGVHLAISAGVPVLFASKEMAAKQIGYRAVASAGKLDGYMLRAGRAFVESVGAYRSITTSEWQNLDEAVDWLKGSRVYVDDRTYRVEDVDAATRRAVRQWGAQLVIVDYLQLLRPSGGRKAGNREQEVASISSDLKEIAKRNNVAMVALAQLSREVDKRDDKRPKLSDLRESGAIEQDADVVVGLYRDSAYDVRKGSGAEIIVLKHRNGRIGTIEANFYLETGQWAERGEE